MVIKHLMMSTLTLIFNVVQLTAMSSQITDKSLKARLVRQVADQWCQDSKNYSEPKYAALHQRYFKIPVECIKEVDETIDQKIIQALQNNDRNALNQLPKAIIKKHVNKCLCKETESGRTWFVPPLFNDIYNAKNKSLKERLEHLNYYFSFGATVNYTVRLEGKEKREKWLDLARFNSYGDSQIVRLFCSHGLDFNKVFFYDEKKKKGSHSHTLLEDAVNERLSHIIKVFLDYGADCEEVLQKVQDIGDLQKDFEPLTTLIKAIVYHPKSFITQEVLEKSKQPLHQLLQFAKSRRSDCDLQQSSLLVQKELIIQRRYHEQHAGTLIVQNNERAIIPYQPNPFLQN